MYFGLIFRLGNVQKFLGLDFLSNVFQFSDLFLIQLSYLQDKSQFHSFYPQKLMILMIEFKLSQYTQSLNNIIFHILMLNLIVLHLLYATLASSQALYNHNSASYRNQTWMSNLDDGIPLRQLTIIGTHSSMSTGTWGDAFQTQGSSLSTQLASGIRALDIRCRHYQNSFAIHQRLVYLNTDLGGVLTTVQSFLTSYPRETVLMHIVEEYNPSGNSRSFQETFISYKNTFSNLIWIPTTQNPSLGMTRGKVVIIQNFAGAVHGLLYGSFTSIQHKQYSTNWDQYDRWVSIKTFITATSAAGSSRLSFWTGSVGSFPYFCASGKSSPGNNDPRLATGLTTPGFKSYYPDFPRVACFIGICTIAFEGINILGNNFINANGYNYLGIVFIDFPGDVLISSFIAKNGNLFGKCTVTQLSQGCTACSTAGICIACNDLLHYIFDPLTSTCLAEVGYYLNTTSVPNLCSLAMPGCLQCTSDTMCTLCDTYLNYQLLAGQCEAANGFYLDINSIPVKCNIPGCYLCSSATVCTNCSSKLNYIMDSLGDCVCNTAQNFTTSPSGVCICIAGLFLNPNGTCQPIPLCPANNSGCITCVSNVCTLCDAAAGFYSYTPYCYCSTGLFYDGVGCSQCNATQPACVECISDQICLQCVNNFTLTQGQCVCNPQYYLFDSDTCLQCSIGCLSCTGASNCSICDANASFLLVGGLCTCQFGKYVDLVQFGQKCVPCGAMPGCINCNMGGCIACDSILGFLLTGITCDCNFGYYVDLTMNLCSQCVLEGCLDCVTATECVVCDNSTYQLDPVTLTCLQICGDGVLFSLQCDDNNTLDGDGCSSTCKIQKDFTCSGGSSQTPSACSYSGAVNLTLISFQKVDNENKVQIKLLLTPNIPLFDTIDYEACIVPNFPYATKQTIYNSQTGQISLIFIYDKSLNTNNQMQVNFIPPAQDLSFFYTPSTKLSLPETTDNNLALKVYSPQVYNMMPILNILGYILMGLSLGGFIFGLFFSSKLMGVQMMMVVQIAYTGLISVHKLETLLYPLINLWPVNGYNKILPDKTNGNLPPRVSIVGYKSWFLANFNADAALILLPFIVGFAIYIYSKAKGDKQKRIKSYTIFKQWGMTLLLFVQIHLIASICLGILYGIDQLYGIIVGGVLSLLIILMAILLVVRPKNFGEYKTFFQLQTYKSNFYVLVILLRFLVSASISSFNGMLGLAIGIGAMGLQILALIIFRPYKSNLRPVFNTFVTIITLSIYTGYQIRIIDEAEWITTYVPIFLLIILLVCVLINILLMVRHWLCNSEQIQKVKADKYFQQFENSMENQTRRNMTAIQETANRIKQWQGVEGNNLKQSMASPPKVKKADLFFDKEAVVEMKNLKQYENI